MATTVRDDTKEKLKCILDLVPPATWTNKEAGQFRWNYLIQTGKRVPSSVPSYPFSGFFTGTDYVFTNTKGADDTLPKYDRTITLDDYISSLTSAGDLNKDIGRIFTSLISDTRIHRKYQPYNITEKEKQKYIEAGKLIPYGGYMEPPQRGGYTYEEEDVGSNAFHLRKCNEKLNEKEVELEAKAWGAFDKSYYRASHKRRKLGGFERAIWLVHDNRNVGKFDVFMNNPNYDDSDLIIKIKTDRKNDDVKELDQHIELAARHHLQSAWTQMTNAAQFIATEIDREREIFERYLEGTERRDPSTLNRYIKTFAQYNNPNVVMSSMMVIEHHRAWKKWQGIAKGLEQAYDDGLHDYSNRHEIGLLENATAVATITVPSVNRATVPNVPTRRRQPLAGPPLPPPLPAGGLNVPPPPKPAVNVTAIQQAQQQQQQRANKIVTKCIKFYGQVRTWFNDQLMTNARTAEFAGVMEVVIIKNASKNLRPAQSEGGKSVSLILKANEQVTDNTIIRLLNEATICNNRAALQTAFDKEYNTMKKELKDMIQLAKDQAAAAAAAVTPPSPQQQPPSPQRVPTPPPLPQPATSGSASFSQVVSGKNITVSKGIVENKFVVLDDSDMTTLDNNDRNLELIRDLSLWDFKKNNDPDEVLSTRGRDIDDIDVCGQIITNSVVVFDSLFLEDPTRYMTDFLIDAKNNNLGFIPSFVLYRLDNNGNGSANGGGMLYNTMKEKITKVGRKKIDKPRKQKIDNLWQMTGSQIFTEDGTRIQFTFNGEAHNIVHGGVAKKNASTKVKYLLVMENMGRPLVDVVSYNFENASKNGDNWTVSNLNTGNYPFNPFRIEQQLESAIDAFGNLGYLHRDVKLDNICINYKGELSFIDLERVTKMSSTPGQLDGDTIPRGKPIANGPTLIDIPGDGFCFDGTNNCDKYQGALALMNLGGCGDLTGDYIYSPDISPEHKQFLIRAKGIFNSNTVDKVDAYKLFGDCFNDPDKYGEILNLPSLLVKQIFSQKWIVRSNTLEAYANMRLNYSYSLSVNHVTPNRVTIEYDSMSEADIEEIEKAMSMYSEELEKYDSSSDVSEQKESLYDSSSAMSEQKASLYDSSSEQSGSEISEQKASLYDSSSEGESPSVTRVPYDSSSEIASETELDYSLGSDSEREESEGNVPYNSDSDLDSI